MNPKKNKLTTRSNSNIKFATINKLYKSGQLNEALIRVRQVLSKNTKDLDLLYIAGLLELQVGSAKEAIKWLYKVHVKIPENLDTLDNLGNAYCAAGLFNDGLEQYQKLINMYPERIQTWCNLGSVHSKLGNIIKARAAYKLAIERDPKFIAALTNLALLEGQSGDWELALKLYYQVLLLQPTNGEVYSDLSRFKKFSKNDPDIIKMEKLIGSNIVTSQDKMFLGYALAKAYEDTGQLEKSFNYLNMGNKTKRASLIFNIDDVQYYVDNIIKTFTSEVFVPKKKLYSKQVPIFIVGMPRSGTTLVEQIIASHSQVLGGGELTTLRDVITGRGASDISIACLSKSNESYPFGVLSLSSIDLLEIGKTYLRLANKSLNAKIYFTDKMPLNFFFIGMIKLVLPQAKIIHCKRSPLDTCLSCYSIHFPYGQEFSNELTELGLYYREYDRLMRHWNKIIPGEILNISYEDIVTNTRINTQKLLNFCELSWEENCIEFHKTKRQITTASSSQVRQPIYSTAINRWKRYKAHLQPLISALGPLVDL